VTAHDPRFWQGFGPLPEGVTEAAYAAQLPDGATLMLPVRAQADRTHGLASLIINQASFAVQLRLAALLAERLLEYQPEVIVGLPTLGLTVAAQVAQILGHTRYVAAGTSRKFWYDAEHSVPVSSVTTPDAKRLWIDPRLLPLLKGRRVALIDDVMSTGQSLRAGLELLTRLAARPVVAGVIMLQTERWRAAWPADMPICHVLASPQLVRDGDVWTSIVG
jgi:adenine/guanine phosphoribosyltransferase-like PRPP-binding protein